jgi:2-hydroxycyclohexanecarboxyl-CoA dehydrogenase
MRGSGCALVTGAAGGIGEAVVHRLERDGYTVAGVDLRASDATLSLLADVTDAGEVAEAVEAAAERLGPPVVVVNAAGVYEEAPVAEIGVARWSAMLRLHLGGTANVCRATVPQMLGAGGGRVVNVASELALSGAELACHYAAAKGAVFGLTRALALELAQTGVRVNAVAPRTDRHAHAP